MKLYAICWQRQDGDDWSVARSGDLGNPEQTIFWEEEAAATTLDQHLAEVEEDPTTLWSVQAYDVPEPSGEVAVGILLGVAVDQGMVNRADVDRLADALESQGRVRLSLSFDSADET